VFDPRGLLNDGVVLTDDPRAHLKHIKAPTPVDPLVDACVECGYCEPVCPARTLTLTPRQRIVVQREIGQAWARGDLDLVKALEQAYVYDGVHTCAVDGLCSLACPVGINTGTFIKTRRAAMASNTAQSGWELAADHWAGATHVASFALSAAHGGPTALGHRVWEPLVTGVTRLGRRVIGDDQMPLWSPDLPDGGRSRRRPYPNREPVAVYVPACVGSMFGSEMPETPGETKGTVLFVSSSDDETKRTVPFVSPETPGVQAAFEQLCALAGLALVVPEEIDALCCGTPWSSKGMTRGYQAMSERVIPAVRAASGNGRLPIVCDASSCTEGLQRMLADQPDLTVIDCVQFVAEMVLPRLAPVKKVASLTLHQTCSSTQIGLNPYLVMVAQAVADQVNVPIDGGCCAFAGDRGMLHPELTRAATRPEAAEVARLGAAVHASCNRTCEIGMSRATGVPYRHVLEILAELAPA